MSELRERGIYALPDGDEVIACAAQRGYYFLHRLLTSTLCVPAYVVNLGGEILSVERRTPWSVTDLTDTGRTSHKVRAAKSET